MASTKLANFIVDARGKIAGTVYSHGKAGSYAKQSFVPSNPSTTRQINRRAQVRSMQSKWKELTQAQRDLWNKMSFDYPVQNRVGDTVVLSGHQLFIKLNLNLRSIPGLITMINTPPTKRRFSTASFNFTVATNTDPTLTLTVVRTILKQGTSNTQMRSLIYATAGLSPGAYNPAASMYKLVHNLAGISGTMNFGSQYLSIFGLPAIGSQVFVKIVWMSLQSGLTLNAATVSRIVT